MKKLGFLFLLVVGFTLSLAPAAFARTYAQHSTHRFGVYEANLGSLNGSGASGTAFLFLNGNRLTVTMYSFGLAPNQVHAQHIHGNLGVVNTCPTAANDTNGDGLISVPEGKTSYGGFQASLTTTGDTSPNSALAVSRFPVAGPYGTLFYSRTFTVPDSVANNLGSFAIVQHGVDLNGDGTYDGAASPVAPSLPMEATIPADCGQIYPLVNSFSGNSAAGANVGANIRGARANAYAATN